MKTNIQNSKNNKTGKQQETGSQQATPAATLPDVVKVQSQHWDPGSAESLSAAQFRAELKAQQLERLLAQVDQQAEEAVDAMMGNEAAAGSAAKGARSHRVIMERGRKGSGMTKGMFVAACS